jgi:hypothetical protein
MKKISTDFQAEQVLAQLFPKQVTAEQLDKLAIAYAAGDKRALAVAIQLSGGRGLVTPEWVVTAFKAGLDAMMECEATSWDEILGGNPKGKRLANAQRNRRWTLAIVELLEDHPAGSINADFFEALAVRLRNAGHQYITGAHVRKLYYQLPDAVRLRPSD